MSEPITLYDGDGNEVIMYSPTVAHYAVLSGKLFAEPPHRIEMAADERTGAKVTLLFPTADDKAAYLRRVDEVNAIPKPPPDVAFAELRAEFGAYFDGVDPANVDADMPALDGMPEPEPVRKAGRPRKGTK
jgi:hypothetical protein